MLPAISPQEAFERFSKGEARLVDIRETDEYTQEFVPGSRLIPLSIIAKHPLKDADAPDKPIVFFCHSGNRTANASDLLERLAGDVQAYRLDGGISGWEKAGLPVEHISSTIPLFRQIQIAAGSLVLIGVIGSAFWHPFFWLSAFVGAAFGEQLPDLGVDYFMLKPCRLSALADMRFSFIGDVCGRCVVKPHESREHVRSVKIDRILTGRYTAIPAFLVIMGLVFWLTFGVIGAALQGLMEDGIAAIIASADAGLKAFGTNDVVRSLAVDGVLTGVGSVLTFLPIIVVLFLFLSILEDSGYMARVAFVMDKLLRKIGLSGRTVKPKLIITLGISGAVQFAAGMKAAECIVAVNSDPAAPIFDVAHYRVVGDVNEILPRLIQQIKGVS